MEGGDQVCGGGGVALTRWAEERWAGRLPGSRPDLTPVPLVVTRSLAVRAPAERAFAVLADPANAPLRTGSPASFGFVVPGTPAGMVGERRCVVVPSTFGTALVGAVSDVVEVVPGRRLVLMPRGPGRPLRTTLAAEPTGPDTCVLRVSVHATAPAAGTALIDELHGAELEHDLAAVAHVVAGGPPPGPVVEGVLAKRMRTADDRAAWQLATAPRTTITVHAAVDVPVPPVRAWLAVADARGDRWWDHDPDAVSFTVPGTPAGRVGELRCVLRHETGGLGTAIAEVLAVDEGRALVTRDRGHQPGVRTTWVEPAPGGSRITREAVLDVLDDSPARRAHEAEDLRRGLEALARHLTR